MSDTERDFTPETCVLVITVYFYYTVKGLVHIFFDDQRWKTEDPPSGIQVDGTAVRVSHVVSSERLLQVHLSLSPKTGSRGRLKDQLT